MIKFEFYSTPGHGYLKVPLQLLRELQISQLISRYSYIDTHDNVYCEEDCDMGIVCTRLELDKIKFEINDTFYVDEEEDFEFTDQFETYDGDEEIGCVEQRSDGLEMFLTQEYEEEAEEI